MIRITKLNGQKLTINCELIQAIEETPDTTITMTTGDKYIAVESIDEINRQVVAYKQGIYGSSMINTGPSLS
ncbi:MAG: flagellar FlbD family protein [Clostridiales bacterium]|jgi:flagellar protein FlbD|nr:flagellar FlbD family protein [Clostridiales bacterium]